MKKLSDCAIPERYGFCPICGEAYLLDNTLATEIYCPDVRCFMKGTHLREDVYGYIKTWQEQ